MRRLPQPVGISFLKEARAAGEAAAVTGGRPLAAVAALGGESFSQPSQHLRLFDFGGPLAGLWHFPIGHEKTLEVVSGDRTSPREGGSLLSNKLSYL